MQLTYFWKDTGSGGGGCPALYGAASDAGTPGYVVQGKVPSAKHDGRPGFIVYGTALSNPVDRAQLRHLAADEDAVWVPAADLGSAAIDDGAQLRGSVLGEAAVWVPSNVLDLGRTPAKA